jgi:hypothetical protein
MGIAQLKNRLAILSVAGLLQLSSYAADRVAPEGEVRRFPQARITAEQWRTFLQETRSKEGAVAIRYVNLTRIVVRQEAAVYFFTRPNHPAHPAAVRRSMVIYADKQYVHTSGYYAGNPRAFVAWMKLFQTEDENWQRRHKERDRSRLQAMTD